MIAVVREPARSLAECELSFIDREHVDAALAAAQHAAYRDALAACGFGVQCLPALEGLPDSVFVEDAAVVLDELIVLARPGAPSRAPEVDAIAPHLAPLGRVERLRGGRLDGGDVLRIGRTLWVGLSGRTDAAGIGALSAIAEPLGYTVLPVPLRGCLHLKTGATAASDDTVIVNPAWVDPTPWRHLRVVQVHPTEPFGANVLRAGGKVLVSEAAPRTADMLAALGFETLAVDIGELEKAEAGLTCLSLLLDHRS